MDHELASIRVTRAGAGSPSVRLLFADRLWLIADRFFPLPSPAITYYH